MLQPGDTVDRYVVEAHVGSGATADVYRVRHRLLGTLHALKVIRSAGAGQRFRREAKAQAAVRHPHVIAVTDAFTVGSAPALLLDWVDGISLADHIPPGGLPPDEVDRLFRGIAEGVAAIHAAGIVHRDLKPANVMLSGRARQPRVADFGLVKLLDSLDDPVRTRAGTVMGTPCYMAPEQAADSASVGPAADVWALGACLYELLSGKRIFDGETVDEVLSAVTAGNWVPLSGISAAHENILAACLVMDPVLRLPDAGALLAWLGGPATATVVPDPPETWNLAPVSPPDRPQRTHGNLPNDRTRFIGRTEDLSAISERFSNGARLVSIVGPGGAGKTRLALAWARQAAFPGGAWFVDLTEAQTGDAVTFALAQALGIGLSGSEGADGATMQVGRAIDGRGKSLFVLDNLEQVVAAAPTTVGRWLAMAPEARFLVTTRERLQLDGETCISGEPLPIDVAERLFDERAGDADPGWDATRYRADVRAILARVDCMPLAIELAAARVRMFPPPELCRRLESGAAILKSSRRDVTARQASVEGAVAWSWALLSPPEQAALTQLSLFRGGFTLDAAEAIVFVAAFHLPPEPWELLQSLIDKSLVRRWEGEAGPRFGMYVTISAFAAARLAELDPRREAATRFTSFWAERGPELVAAARSADDLAPLRHLVAEEDNLRAALDIAVATDSDRATIIFRAVERLLWAAFGDGSPRHRTFISGEAAAKLLAPSVDGVLRREVRASRLRWLIYTLPPDAIDAELAALAEDGATDGEQQALAALFHARRVALAGDPTRAEGLYAAAAALVERHCGAFETFRVHAWWGALLGSLGRWKEREAAYARLLDRAREQQDRWTEIIVLTNRGAHRGEAGNLPGSEADYRAALAMATRVGLAKFIDVNVGNLGSSAWVAGRIEEARDLLSDAVKREVASGHGAVAASCAAELAWACELLGRTEEADERILLARPDAISRLHEYDRASTWRLVAFWRYHRGELASAGGALTEAESVVSEASPARAVLTRLRAAIAGEEGGGVDVRAALVTVEAPNATDRVVLAMLDVLIRAAQTRTAYAWNAAASTFAALDVSGASGPIRLAARAAGSAIRRLAERGVAEPAGRNTE